MRTVTETNPRVDPEKQLHRSFQEYAELARRAGLATLGSGPVAFSGSVHDKELMAHQLANAAMVQLFDASALAPGDMKDKVLAFQDEVKTFLVHYMKEAMRSERHRIGLLLEASGHSNAAALIRQG